ncbi:MAG: hypothetical protein HFJ33_01660 [Clostridia bacterium]|nr:hypothetical protein [Clostridia bacterium]
MSYVSFWNKKYERVGHLFQDRFLSKNVETKNYLKNVCRYVHQNPSKIGISKMEEYHWSSYQEYVNRSKMIDGTQILELFSENKKTAIHDFVEFHKKNEKEENIKEYIEYEMIEKLTDEQAKRYLSEILELKNIQEIVQYNPQMRKEYLKKAKCAEKISKAQIARLTGLTKRMVEMAMKEEK